MYECVSGWKAVRSCSESIVFDFVGAGMQTCPQPISIGLPTHINDCRGAHYPESHRIEVNRATLVSSLPINNVSRPNRDMYFLKNVIKSHPLPPRHPACRGRHAVPLIKLFHRPISLQSNSGTIHISFHTCVNTKDTKGAASKCDSALWRYCTSLHAME